MLFGIFGTPSPLTSWMVGAVRTVIELSFPQNNFVETSNLDQLREALKNSGDVPLVYFFDSPEADVVEAFLGADAPFLVCLESPLEVLGYCMRAREMRPVDALRFGSMCFATLHDLALSPKAKVIQRNPDLLVSDCIVDIWTTFSLAHDPALAVEAVRRLVGGLELRDERVDDLIVRLFPHALPFGKFSNQMIEMGVPNWVAKTLSHFGQIASGNAVDTVFWPRDAFLDPHSSEHPIAPFQDLTGPSRGLIFGPFLYLPAGKWRIVASLEIVDVGSNALRADVAIAGEPVAVVKFNLPDRGRFEFSLEFEVKEPRQYLEFRIILAQGAIEGLFWFGGVMIVRSGSDSLNELNPGVPTNLLDSAG